MSDFEDCLRKGLLRKVTPSKVKAESSMKKAERWFYEAERNLSS